jgi:hypothetical protein
MTESETNEVATQQQLASSAKRFQDLYAEMRSEIEKEHCGEYIAINLVTGRHVLGPTSRAALEIAKNEFGSIDWCWTRRIGAP